MRALEEEEAGTLSPPTVRRLCPYCKDDLRSEPQVLCAGCLTPHHRGCFSENRVCCLLGCGSRRSLSLEEPAPDGGPRPLDPRRFAALGLALLFAGLATGWLLEAKQNALIDLFAREAFARERLARERELRDLMTRITKAQNEYRRHDPNGEYASSWEALSAVASSSLYMPAGVRVRVCSTRGDAVPRYCAIAVPAPREPADSPRTVLACSGATLCVALDEDGVNVYWASEEPLALDETNCRVVVPGRGNKTGP